VYGDPGAERGCPQPDSRDKIHQIYSPCNPDRKKYGMQTFNQSLARLTTRNRSRWKWRWRAPAIRNELTEMIARGANLLNGQLRPRARWREQLRDEKMMSSH